MRGEDLAARKEQLTHGATGLGLVCLGDHCTGQAPLGVDQATAAGVYPSQRDLYVHVLLAGGLEGLAGSPSGTLQVALGVQEQLSELQIGLVSLHAALQAILQQLLGLDDQGLAASLNDKRLLTEQPSQPALVHLSARLELQRVADGVGGVAIALGALCRQHFA